MANHLVDRLGLIRAQIAQLREQERTLVDEIKALGVDALDGDYYHVAVVRGEREQIDWKAIAAKLRPSRQLITAHTRHVPYVQVRVTARKADAA